MGLGVYPMFTKHESKHSLLLSVAFTLLAFIASLILTPNARYVAIFFALVGGGFAIDAARGRRKPFASVVPLLALVLDGLIVIANLI
jgi:hypothetical protein